jgi:L-asparaginase II
MAQPVPLVRVLRAGRLESRHFGSFAVWQDGRVVRAVGDVDRPVFYRSTAKPFQALVAVTSGAAERFGLVAKELAVATGSHNAQPEHLVVVRSILTKAEIPEEALRCGGHFSIYPKEAARQHRSLGEGAHLLPAIWSNCSGKHAAFLAAAKAMDAPLDDYLEASHPVQREVHRHVALFTGEEPTTIPTGVDGCGAPIQAVPLSAMARSLALLGRPDGIDAALGAAAKRVVAAMAAHPRMVAGDGRFDTDLMTTAQGRLVAKGGAEGVEGVCVPERGIGIAIKVEDGNDRGQQQVVIHLLAELGLLTEEEAGGLAARHGAVLRNHAGREVGRIEVAL